jgi:hypothetical protein
VTSQLWPNDVAVDPRCALMVGVTLDTLRQDPDLRLCEGLRLIDATRTAVGRMAPAALQDFETRVIPQMREILLERFGVCPPLGDAVQ